jgi:hypothetical protein
MAEVNYQETEANEDDPEGRILYALAKGQPYAFITAVTMDPLNLRVASELPDVDTLRALLVQTLRALPGGMKEVSDGYHTFRDLYDHRRALTATLAASAASAGDSWRSKAHHPEDGPMFEGSFIVGIELPTGTITYHYNLEFWDDFSAVPELEHGKKWDGATPDDTVTRLLGLARLVAAQADTE